MRADRLKPALPACLALLLCAGAAHAFPWSGDMRRSPGFKPQRVILMPPDSTVPRTGKVDRALMRDAADKIHNPTPRSPQSEAHGQKLFNTYCFPCHGTRGLGDGPVSAKFPGVANLTQPSTLARSDGFIYFYVRHGGILMPSYGYAIKTREAWDLVNYVRKLQGK